MVEECSCIWARTLFVTSISGIQHQMHIAASMSYSNQNPQFRLQRIFHSACKMLEVTYCTDSRSPIDIRWPTSADRWWPTKGNLPTWRLGHLQLEAGLPVQSQRVTYQCRHHIPRLKGSSWRWPTCMKTKGHLQKQADLPVQSEDDLHGWSTSADSMWPTDTVWLTSADGVRPM